MLNDKRNKIRGYELTSWIDHKHKIFYRSLFLPLPSPSPFPLQLSACLGRAQRLKGKNDANSKAKNQKARAQPTRASQRTRGKAPAEKKGANTGPVNTSDEFEKPKAKRLKKSNSKTNVSQRLTKPISSYNGRQMICHRPVKSLSMLFHKGWTSNWLNKQLG